ncbi:hypothetical protein GHO43_26390, partial [Pseudomonas sp. FSL R10-0071]|nr:hypothetical protein [Pseudomonas sp. FSL R10-0071]
MEKAKPTISSLGADEVRVLKELKCTILRFLDEQGIREPEELVKGTLLLFVHWLKQHPSLSYSTASAQFRGLRPFFIQMSKHEKVSCEFVPPKNAFPKASSLQSASLGYDK